MSKNAIKRILRDLADFQRDPPSCCSAGPKGDNLFEWEALIFGSEGSPYEEGQFKLSIKFKEDYPLSPPDFKFITPIWHPNISTSGNICLDIIKPSNWSSAHSIGSILVSITSLLTDPNPDSPLNSEAASQYKESQRNYARVVRRHIRKHSEL
eukprot:gnl/Dysnectes_brevis/483_a536_6007.p1 GENE.gnl/Dysnectes_brevis/483_a536_6007~~gnl/Dysnectes_brevis/483_a536_6007.p1  ORF type:complete len:153 (+),score=24.90 gnl/Dysnectes_brevis/483_a536_6007:65-523(+)